MIDVYFCFRVKSNDRDGDSSKSWDLHHRRNLMNKMATETQNKVSRDGCTIALESFETLPSLQTPSTE